MTPFRKILVPHDFSRHATEALGYAARLVPPNGRIVVMHVVPPFVPLGEVPPAAYGTFIDVKELVAGARRELDRAIAKALPRRLAARVERIVVVGDPYQRIVAAARGMDAIDPRAFDVVIVDEFHHAAARSYEDLLRRLEPEQLLGLTATPERADGLDVLGHFDGRIAAELRLWDAVDQHYLVPFAYFGVHDGTDLRQYLLSHARPSDIAQAAKAECLKDEQVEDVTITVEVLDDGRQLKLTLGVTDAAGPFTFTMDITQAATTLVGLEAEAA